MSINQRVGDIVKVLYSGNKAAFSQAIGVTPSVIENILGSRQGSPSFQVLQKIMLANANINPHWLILGDGGMFRSSDTGPPEPIHTQLYDSNSIPLLVAAENIQDYSNRSNESLEEDKYYIPLIKDADFLLPVHGDSMSPKYIDGDIVACKALPLTDLIFLWNKVYILDTDQHGVIIKRVIMSSREKYVTVVSENAFYDPFDVPLDQIKSIAIVIGVIRRE